MDAINRKPIGKKEFKNKKPTHLLRVVVQEKVTQMKKPTKMKKIYIVRVGLKKESICVTANNFGKVKKQKQ